MAQLRHAENFRDLVVYQKSRQVAQRVFRLTKRLPKGECYALTDQIRRSSRSVGAQISEAWARRRSERHFISKFTDADGEQQETQHWIELSFDCEYLNTQERDGLVADLQEIGRMLNAMIHKATLFCGEPPSTVREQ